MLLAIDFVKSSFPLKFYSWIPEFCGYAYLLFYYSPKKFFLLYCAGPGVAENPKKWGGGGGVKLCNDLNFHVGTYIIISYHNYS